MLPYAPARPCMVASRVVPRLSNLGTAKPVININRVAALAQSRNFVLPNSDTGVFDNRRKNNGGRAI